MKKRRTFLSHSEGGEEGGVPTKIYEIKKYISTKTSLDLGMNRYEHDVYFHLFLNRLVYHCT